MSDELLNLADDSNLSIDNIDVSKISGHSTIDKAVTIINESEKTTNVHHKKTGLELALIGLAEVHAFRLAYLSNAVMKLEKQVFKEENLNSLDPRKIVDLYRMSVDALNNSSSYIKNVISSVNINNLQLSIVSAAESMDEETDTRRADTTRAANDLLKQLASTFKAEESQEPTQSTEENQKNNLPEEGIG